MALVSRSQLAALKAKTSKTGTCTTQAVKNRKFTCEVMTPQGAMYDSEDPEVLAWLSRPTATGAKKDRAGSATSMARKPPPKPPQNLDALDGVVLRKKPGSKPVKDYDRGGDDPEGPDYESIPSRKLPWADRKVKSATLKLELETKIKAGEHVPREDVRQAFMKFYSIHTSILPAIPPVKGLEIAKALGRPDIEGITIATQILDDAVYAALTEIKNTMVQHLKTFEVTP